MALALAYTDSKETPNIDAQMIRALVDDSSASMVWMTDLDLRILAARGGALRVAGLDTAPLVGKTLPDLLACEQAPDRVVIAHMHALMGETVAVEVDWQERSYAMQVVPFRNEEGRISGVVGTALDVTEHHRSLRNAEWYRRHDPLTSLPNRQNLRETLNRAIAEAKRSCDTFALALMDVDDFSRVNDAWGQSVGDEVLRQVAARIHSAVGDVKIARTDGDEFAILIPEADSETARRVTAQLTAALRQPFIADGRQISLTASFGAALFPADGDNAHYIMRGASVALRRSKEMGGNQYHRCSASLIVPARERLVLSEELRGAIERDELSLHYQPQIRLEDGALVAMEALLRWNHGGEIVPAAHFIRIAEESHLIVPIGTWVLDEACRQYAEWMQRDIAPQRVAVNIGARHFHHPQLVNTVRETLERYGLAGTMLEIEITETAAMQDLDITMAVIDELRQLGVGIAIDDFGTGHSSLSYLKRFAITALKVDRSFVSDLNDSDSAAALVEAIMATARALGLRVVAEGVENTRQADWLREAGCDEAQGFLFAKPVDSTKASEYLQHAGRPTIA
ncbi:MAG: EAL domain-containing protein [Thermoanaerobaculia bacterium]|nr:EAL domain-containing protein [Thermoanaerobaculia bacterium]